MRHEQLHVGQCALLDRSDFPMYIPYIIFLIMYIPYGRILLSTYYVYCPITTFVEASCGVKSPFTYFGCAFEVGKLLLKC